MRRMEGRNENANERICGIDMKSVARAHTHTQRTQHTARNNRWADDDTTHLGDDFAHLTEVRTAAEAAACEEVLDEPRADVVAHLLELLVDLGVVLIVLYELHDECAVRQGEELCVLSSLSMSGCACTYALRRLTIFSVRPFQRSSPIALYCLLVVAIPRRAQ